MLKNILLFFILSISCLYAETHYDIIPLAPDGMLTTLTENGYVAGTGNLVITDDNRYLFSRNEIFAQDGHLITDRGFHFFYHPSIGFHIVPVEVPNAPNAVTLPFINDEGILTGMGQKKTRGLAYIYDTKTSSFGFPFCVYQEHGNDAFLMNFFGWSYYPLSISENGLIVIRNYHFESSHVLYDLKTGAFHRDFPNNILYVHTNTLGQAIGCSENRSGGWFYDPQVGITQLGFYGEKPFFPSYLNNTGCMGDKDGIVWSQNLGFRKIPGLKKYQTEFRGINDRGELFGIVKLSSKKNTKHAVHFSEATGTIDLKTLGGTNSEALHMNNHGVIVGVSDVRKGKETHAFVWDKNNGMRDLNDLVPDKEGWKALTKALKINNQGYIIGEGLYKGQKYSYLLIPR